LVDQLHEHASVTDGLWQSLRERYTEAQLVELVSLVGQYHFVAFIANAFEVELEETAKRFP
jgi:alkylhydroperoxidase family enzyme